MRLILGRQLVPLVIIALLFQGCGGRGGGASAVPAVTFEAAKSVSPGAIAASPMAQTSIQPPSVMTSVRLPKSAIQPLGWTQLPGGAIYVAASPDGSIWVLSSLGSGPDRSIWHYANGSWTNIPGAAMRLAVAPNGTLWAVNSAGGIYSYNGSTWSTIAGGASDISVGADGSVYVISNQGGGPYGRGIWHYVGGAWSQLPGAAVRIAASWDAGTYPGGIVPGGFYVTTAINSIYYYNPTTGFNQIPGGVLQVAPTPSGGFFALGYVQSSDGSSPIYFNNLENGTWAQQPGAGTSIATDGAHVYVTGAAGGIYSAPAATPNRVKMTTKREISGTVYYLDVTFTNLTSNDVFVDFVGSGACSNVSGFCSPNSYGWNGEMTLHGLGDSSTVYLSGNPNPFQYPVVPRVCFNAWFPASESFATYSTAQVVCVGT
jgi:virginiamycin B lyase